MSDDEFDFRAWRERLGLTQAEVAEEFDVSVSWVQSVELGRRSAPGRLLEYACIYIDRALEKPDPALGLLTKAEITDRLDGISRQVDALGVLVRRLPPAVDTLKAGQRKLLEAAGLPVPREGAPAVIPGMEAAQRPRNVMPAPPTAEELDRMEAHARRVREMQEAEAAREAEEGE